MVFGVNLGFLFSLVQQRVDGEHAPLSSFPRLPPAPPVFHPMTSVSRLKLQAQMFSHKLPIGNTGSAEGPNVSKLNPGLALRRPAQVGRAPSFPV